MKRCLEKAICAALFYSGFIALIRRLTRQKIPVLWYHRVNDDRDAFFPAVSTADFERQMEYLSRKYTIISLEEAVNLLKSGAELHASCAVITFDDGYKDNYLHAYPILRKYRAQATIFLSSGFMDQRALPWTEKVHHILRTTRAGEIRGLHRKLDGQPVGSLEQRVQVCNGIKQMLKAMRDDEKDCFVERLGDVLGVPIRGWNDPSLMLSWREVQEMSAQRICFGAHAVTHPILLKVSEDRARTEILGSRDEVKARTGQTFIPFAYPNGDYDDSIIRILKDNAFPCACTTHDGLNDSDTSLFEIRRIPVLNCPTYLFAANAAGLLGWIQRGGGQLLKVTARFLRRTGTRPGPEEDLGDSTVSPPH